MEKIGFKYQLGIACTDSVIDALKQQLTAHEAQKRSQQEDFAKSVIGSFKEYVLKNPVLEEFLNTPVSMFPTLIASPDTGDYKNKTLFDYFNEVLTYGISAGRVFCVIPSKKTKIVKPLVGFFEEYGIAFKQSSERPNERLSSFMSSLSFIEDDPNDYLSFNLFFRF